MILLGSISRCHRTPRPCHWGWSQRRRGQRRRGPIHSIWTWIWARIWTGCSGLQLCGYQYPRFQLVWYLLFFRGFSSDRRCSGKSSSPGLRVPHPSTGGLPDRRQSRSGQPGTKSWRQTGVWWRLLPGKSPRCWAWRRRCARDQRRKYGVLNLHLLKPPANLDKMHSAYLSITLHFSKTVTFQSVIFAKLKSVPVFCAFQNINFQSLQFFLVYLFWICK